MKYILILLLISGVCKGQDSINYKITGYCGKMKLTEIKAKWGEAAFTSRVSILAGSAIKEFVFDYGQYYKKDREAYIHSGDDKPIMFGSITSLLNFMDYNGWEYKEVINNNGSYIVLFKNKNWLQ